MFVWVCLIKRVIYTKFKSAVSIICSMVISTRPPFFIMKSHKFINYRFLVESLVEKKNQKSYLVLDAGCGKGLSIVSPPENIHLVGVDILRSNVKAGREKWKNRSYIVADLMMLPFVEGAFTGIICADVLEHVEVKSKVVMEFARITQSQGFFVGSSSNLLSPVLWLDAKLPRIMKPLVKKFTDPGHYDRHTRFSPISLTKTLSSAGYDLNNFYILGYPQFSLVKSTLPGLSYFWVVFDILTENKILIYFKEILIWHAKKLQD